MKLRELLNENAKDMDDLIKIIKRRLPGATNVKKGKREFAIFTYKNHRFVVDRYFGVDGWVNFGVKYSRKIEIIEDEIREKLEAIDTKEVKNLTKKIRDTSKKLPKKNFSL